MNRRARRAARHLENDASPFALPQELVERVMSAALEVEEFGRLNWIVVADVRRMDARPRSIYCVEPSLAGSAMVAVVRASLSTESGSPSVGLVVVDERGESHAAVMGSLIPHAGAA